MISDIEKEINLCRSASAPPTVEASLSAFGGLLGSNSLSKFADPNVHNSDKDFRSDQAYLTYYYSNSHLNPRLPPPLLSKEDWRFTQRLQGGIGDRKEVSKPPGFHSHKEDSVAILDKSTPTAEWESDGLIGLSGLGIGSKQKSLADSFQHDLGHPTPVCGHPSRPSSRNAIDGNVENIVLPKSNMPLLPLELTSNEDLRVIPDIIKSASYSYADALATSFSRSNTSDPQLFSRALSPCLTPIGGGRALAKAKSRHNSPNSFGTNDNADLTAALSSMNVSANGMADEENHFSSHIECDGDIHKNYSFNMNDSQIHTKTYSHANSSDLGHIHIPSYPQPTNLCYADLGMKIDNGLNLSNSSLVSERQIEFQKTNSFSKRPSMPMTNGGENLHYLYQGADSTNLSYPHYGLKRYDINPDLASSNHFGTGASGNIYSLYENSAMDGVGPRGLGGLSTESEIFNRIGNQLAGNLLDPISHQYLRVAEYAVTQGVALTDPYVDMNYLGNYSYRDLLGLQKAYLESLLSLQKSQYASPLGGKSNVPNHHGFYGSPSYGVGMSHPGSPLSTQIIQNSLLGHGSPIRHNEVPLRIPSVLRNLSPWNMEDEILASSLLEEFKGSKAKCFELSEIVGHVVEFSADQYGSRFIQQKLETATIEEKTMVYEETNPHALALMTDVFGNYVIQKFFELGPDSRRRELANKLNGQVLTLSLQMYGCRVIQKAIEVVDVDQKIRMVGELDGYVMRCVRDQNGNHVIQKCIECVPEESIQFIVTTFYGQVVTLSTHPYGCRVVQRILEHCKDPNTQHKVMGEILGAVSLLTQDQYGNYVVQHILEHGNLHERSTIIKELAGKIVQMSQQKFASNVVEKCLTFGGLTEREILVNEMLGSTEENEPLQAMMIDQFANYVVQKVLETCDDQKREHILSRIKVHLNALKKYTYGKHIVARVEKLVAAGERRTAVQSLLNPPYITDRGQSCTAN